VQRGPSCHLEAVRKGDLESLKRLLGEHPGLASGRIVKAGKSRTALHVATDWPGHFPNGAAVIAALIEPGADPNAPQEGTPYAETPLHWVASSDDVEAFEVLIKAGADIEAPGGSIGGGTPLDNAVGYGQWQVAPRLVDCGARTKLHRWTAPETPQSDQRSIANRGSRRLAARPRSNIRDRTKLIGRLACPRHGHVEWSVPAASQVRDILSRPR
jgi:hypothetical protein